MIATNSQTKTRSLSLFVSRYYWVQIALIALAVILGVIASAFIMKGLLLKAAMEQEAEHYWQRYDKDANAPLPDTKNLYGYIWQGEKPAALDRYKVVEKGEVSSIFMDGKKRTVIYDEHAGKHLLLVFGESNVNRIVWLFGVTPLILSLFLLYSILWYFNKKAQTLVSPVERLVRAIQGVDLTATRLEDKPFDNVDTSANTESQHLKDALANYHETLINFIRRERLFSREVSHELRTPLSVIKGSLQVLEAQYSDVSLSKSAMRMHNTINDMQLIIDTLLAIAREGSNKIEWHTQSIKPIVDHVVDDLSSLAEQRNMVIDIQESETERIKTNDTIAYMVFSNIIRNALNYSQGRKVSVRLSGKTVEIMDDGIGLPDESIQALKKPESKAWEQVSIKGHGIGLKLVQRLCGLLDWKINIQANTVENASGLHVIIQSSK